MTRPLLLLLPILLVPSQSAPAQAGGEPCLRPEIMSARQRGGSVGTQVLYDGVAPLARAPATQIQMPVDIPGGTCVLLHVIFAERDGVVYVDDATFMAVSSAQIQMQMRRADYGRQVVRSATQVVRDAVRQDLFRTKPKGGSRWIVAVPVVSAHPLYARSAVVAAQSSNPPPDVTVSLNEKGFRGSVLLKVENGLDIHRLGERGQFKYFAVVRSIPVDEPILEYVESKDPASPFTVVRYGPNEERRFKSVVAPLLPDRGERFVEVVIYHYAKGVVIDRQPDSRFPGNNERHFETGQLIEPPAAKEIWTGRRQTPGGPFTWFSGGERGTSSTDLNTLASIQSIQRGIAAQQRVFAANRAALDAAEAKELEGRRAARRAREEARARLITAAQLRYLTDETWARYQNGPEMKLVFDGAWLGAVREWEFGNIYSRTIRAFSNRCRYLIPADSPRQIQTTIIRNEFGQEREGASDTTFIPAAFAEPFRWWERNAPEALPLGPAGVQIGDASRLLRLLASPMESMSRAMSDVGLLLRFQVGLREDMAVLFEGGCESPTVKQFMENMRRLALRLPTLQAERAPASLLTEAEWPLSLDQSCRKHQIERGASVGRNWCPCLERELGKSMTLGDRWNALEDYHRFWDEVEGLRTAPDGNPVWARYTPANACRQ